jgi:DNA-binding PadR family transcriptional regulator
MNTASTQGHLPLRSVELDILLGVVDRPRHGYAILQEAEARAGGHPGFEIPTLYRALRRLREAGLVCEAAPPASEAVDERREYWQATALGRQVLRAELSRLETIVATGRERTGKAEAGS